ncbi:hypothetical protein GCM10022278_37440 [Allohahella marinimesophila]|uniref:Uncharacterized protein n=2 Tax=Allohahella marinimesophila TaxID=1054972 RepID=A0ABP7Q6P9_9GAMM
MVTARSPWALIIDSFRTDQSSFLINPYFDASPLSTDGEAGSAYTPDCGHYLYCNWPAGVYARYAGKCRAAVEGHLLGTPGLPQL